MPLRAVSDTGNVHAFEFDAPQWAELKKSYRSMGLRVPCCGVAAVPKTSTLGNHFFAHARRGECTTAPESAEHLYCKQLVAQAAQSAGWAVTTERPGVSPEGEEWVADVFCEKGSAKVALEIQMSPQTDEDAVRRQLRYKASGVRGAWFYGAKARKGTVLFNKDTPAFGLDPVEVGKVPTVRRFETPLTDFVVAMLEKRLVWTIPELCRPLQIEYLPDTCWACHKDVKQVFGHFEGYAETQEERHGWHERAFTVARLSQDLEAILGLASNEELHALGLNPIGRQNVINGKPTNWPYCNLCAHCRAPQNNFHLGEKVRADLYGPDSRAQGDGADAGERGPENSEEARNAFATIPRVVLGEGFWELKGS
jgi:hypothetical protein